jgi:hypothetical protein
MKRSAAQRLLLRPQEIRTPTFFTKLSCANDQITATPTVWIGTCVGGSGAWECATSGPGIELDPRLIGSCIDTVPA